MSENQGGEAATVEVPDTAAAEVDANEERAREQGWRPKDEWTGKPENWKDAKTWVEHGETSSRVQRIEKEYAQRFERLERMNEKTRAAIEATHAKEITDLRAAARTAASKGDLAAYDAANQQIEQKVKDGPTTAAPDTDKDKLPPAEAKWIKENPWYEEDDELNAFAFALSQRMVKKFPANSFEENMKLVVDKTKETFPEKFGGSKNTTSANGHALVDGGGALGGSPPAKTDVLAKLPAEARAQAKRDMAAYPKVFPTADAWLKEYQS